MHAFLCLYTNESLLGAVVLFLYSDEYEFRSPRIEQLLIMVVNNEWHVAISSRGSILACEQYRYNRRIRQG
jgi:hypothetical protein